MRGVRAMLFPKHITIKGIVWGSVIEFGVEGSVFPLCSLPRILGVPFLFNEENVGELNNYSKDSKVYFTLKENKVVINKVEKEVYYPTEWSYFSKNSIVMALGAARFNRILLRAIGFSTTSSIVITKDFSPSLFIQDEDNHKKIYYYFYGDNGYQEIKNNWEENYKTITSKDNLSIVGYYLDPKGYLGSTTVRKGISSYCNAEIINKNLALPEYKTPIPYDIDMKIRSMIDSIIDKVSSIYEDFTIYWTFDEAVKKVSIVNLEPLKYVKKEEKILEWLEYNPKNESQKTLETLIESIKNTGLEKEVGIKILGHVVETGCIASFLRKEGIFYK